MSDAHGAMTRRRRGRKTAVGVAQARSDGSPQHLRCQNGSTDRKNSEPPTPSEETSASPSSPRRHSGLDGGVDGAVDEAFEDAVRDSARVADLAVRLKTLAQHYTASHERIEDLKEQLASVKMQRDNFKAEIASMQECQNKLAVVEENNKELLKRNQELQEELTNYYNSNEEMMRIMTARKRPRVDGDGRTATTGT